MKKQITKKTLVRMAVIALCLLCYGLLLFYANTGWNGYTASNTTGVEYETATVLEVLRDGAVKDEAIEGRRKGSMDLRVEITSGRYQGEEAYVTNYLSALYNVDVGEGDSLSVRIDTVGDHDYQVSVYNYNRTPWLLTFIILFAVALVILGGKQGFKAFLGLIFTFVSVVFLLVPLTLRGWPVIPMTMVLVAVTSMVSFWLLGGWQPKTVGAALGCLCGVAFAAILGYAASELVHITAYQSEEAEALILVQNETDLHLSGLFLASVLVCALGAVMDIAMSVASAMTEVHEKRPELTRKELFRSGMQVGRDATGTMANTLVLAIAGSSFNMMLLIYSYQVSFVQLMNTDFVAIELIRGIAGSMGILLTVPCVAFFTALLQTGKNHR